MHDKLIKYTTQATLDVFATMFGQNLQVASAAKESNDTGPTTGVAAVVGLAGPLAGTGTVVCSLDVACQMASLMLMAEYNEMCSDVLDAMGEIANMIIGNVKTELEAEYGSLGLSTPTVVHGQDFGTRTVAGQPWSVVYFRLENGKQFHVQMAVSRSASASPAAAHHAGSLTTA